MRVNGSKFPSFLLPFGSYLLPFISFYFPESGLFNGLWAIEIRKFACPFRFAQKFVLDHFKQPWPPARPVAGQTLRFSQ
jgi:hypothetical protein